MQTRRLTLITCALAALALAPAGAAAATVFAASSLTKALPKIAPGNTYSFGGSDTLELQITQGARADVFLSAAPLYAQRLHERGLCTEPVTFATNTLALVVPAANPAGINRVEQLDRPGGFRVAAGSRTVPIGIYTRTLLGKLGLPRALQRNTVSQFPKVSDIVTAVALGSAEAGFIYTTDYHANATRLLEIPLPASAQPLIRYQACVVTRAGADTAGGQAVIDRLLSLNGRQQLFNARFGLPPKTRGTP